MSQPLSAFPATFTRTDIESILERVTYRPGWTFEVKQVEDADLSQVRAAKLCLYIDGPVVDAYDHARMTNIGIRNAIPPHLGSEQQFMKWLAYCLQRIEIHEHREYLQIDGQPWSNPHA